MAGKAVESSLQLMGWSCSRRVIVLRRRRQPPQPSLPGTALPQVSLPFVESLPQAAVYEYAVLVTSLGDEIAALAQHYRDRADAENGFDELKNQWGWGGFTTQDLARCQITARIVAQVYNWWSIFLFCPSDNFAKPERCDSFRAAPLETSPPSPTFLVQEELATNAPSPLRSPGCPPSLITA